VPGCWFERALAGCKVQDLWHGPLNCGRQKESMKGSPAPGPGAGAAAKTSPETKADVARAQPDDVSAGADVSI